MTRGPVSALRAAGRAREIDAQGHLVRLLRAESDLKAAIAECTAALAAVRRELDWRHPSPIVH